MMFVIIWCRLSDISLDYYVVISIHHFRPQLYILYICLLFRRWFDITITSSLNTLLLFGPRVFSFFFLPPVMGWCLECTFILEVMYRVTDSSLKRCHICQLEGGQIHLRYPKRGVKSRLNGFDCQVGYGLQDISLSQIMLWCV